MSDVLRVTTPIVNPNQAVANPQAPDPTSPFNLQDTSKVIKSHNQRELYEQNTGTLEGKHTPDILMDLIQDPTVTATYLKNLSTIEEIFKLVPAHNNPLDADIEKLFDSMLLRPESGDLADEMVRQEESATSFRGELFDFLREISARYEGRPDVQYAISDFLKAINARIHREDILDSVGNNFEFLKNELSFNKSLAARLDELSQAFKSASAGDNGGGSVERLKQSALELLGQVRNSLLLSEKAEKVIAITIYNLSRHNSNDEYVAETALKLRKYVDEDGKQKLADLTRSFLEGRASPEERGGEVRSGVMRGLTKIIEQTAKNREGVGDERLDGMLNSLLSSPCNFTPLLHYIVPVDYYDTRAFAEIWINPEGGDNDAADNGEDETHILMVVDVEGTGRFEAELYVHGDDINFSLYCPPGTQDKYKVIGSSLREALADSDYRFRDVNVLPLNRDRSLMQVFKSLPYKRVGIDVVV